MKSFHLPVPNFSAAPLFTFTSDIIILQLSMPADPQNVTSYLDNPVKIFRVEQEFSHFPSLPCLRLFHLLHILLLHAPQHIYFSLPNSANLVNTFVFHYPSPFFASISSSPPLFHAPLDIYFSF